MSYAIVEEVGKRPFLTETENNSIRFLKRTENNLVWDKKEDAEIGKTLSIKPIDYEEAVNFYLNELIDIVSPIVIQNIKRDSKC